MAPEVLNGQYNEKCDIWSCGVVLYLLLTGNNPFESNDENKLLDLIKKGLYNKRALEFASYEAKDLLDNLLTIDYEKRLSAEAALNHPWFKKTLKSKKTQEAQEKQVLTNLVNFNAREKVQTAIFHFFTHYIALESDKNYLLNQFKEIDTNFDGTLNKEEILNAVKKSFPNLSKEAGDSLFRELDLNKNDKIDYSEFITATIDKEKFLNVNRIEQIFNLFDTVFYYLYLIFICKRIMMDKYL